tara:strand:- start:73 stop:552 length:480 start_codon:yes stop_codon:yes gene_type:complete
MITDVELRQLEDLAVNATREAKELPKEVNRIKKVAAEWGMFNLLRLTAFFLNFVDTSKALSNWQVAITGIPKTEIEAHFLGGTAVGATKGSTKVASYERASRIADMIISEAKPGEPIVIYNNVSYIKEMEKRRSGYLEEETEKIRNRTREMLTFINFHV